MVPADSGRISRVPPYSGSASPSAAFSATGLSPSPARLSRAARLTLSPGFLGAPTTPAAPRRRRFGLLRFRSPLLAESLLFSSPAGTEMFQFPAFAPPPGGNAPAGAGLPHSDIAGSMRICRSPTLFAACHVLLRSREPRHPSCALLSFSFSLRLPPLFAGADSGFVHFGPLACFFEPAAPSGVSPPGPRPPLCCDSCLFVQTSAALLLRLRQPTRGPAGARGARSRFPVLSMSLCRPAAVVPGRVELPTSTLSV